MTLCATPSELLPETLIHNNEEEEDDVFDHIRNRRLSHGSTLVAFLLERQNSGHLSDGLNVTLELVASVKKRYIGEHYFEQAMDVNKPG